jgi:16S rRNA processing protein RimM
MIKALTRIGQIQSTHGLKGELVIGHYLQNANEMKDWEALMVELYKDSFVPYFILSVKQLNKSEILVLFDEVQSPELAKELLGCNVYASPLISVNALIKNDWDDIIGFSISEKTTGRIGVILEVSQGVGQQFFHVQNGEKEMMIPIQEQWITNVDAEKKVITMDLPDGFVEVFG